MTYERIVALLLVLTMASTSSLGQSRQSDDKDESNRGSVTLAVVGVALAVVVAVTGSYRIIKHFDKATETAKTVKKVAGKGPKSKAPPSVPNKQATVNEHSEAVPQETGPPVRQAEHQDKQVTVALEEHLDLQQ